MEVDSARSTELEQLAAELRDPALREPVEAGEGFHGVLRPYQESGLGWLVGMRRLGLGALLADDMGLGKTVQLIAYLLERSDQADSPALIVCPASVLGNWRRELGRFAPDLSVHVHHGPDRTHRHRRPDRPRRGADLLLAAAARPPAAGRGGVAGAGAGRGAAGQEPAHARRAGRPRAARRATASRSRARRSRTGWTSCGRSCTSSTRACWTPAAPSAAATPRRSSGTATRTRPRGCGG